MEQQILDELRRVNANLERLIGMMAKERPSTVGAAGVATGARFDVGSEVQKQLAAARAEAERAMRSTGTPGIGDLGASSWPGKV